VFPEGAELPPIQKYLIGFAQAPLVGPAGRGVQTPNLYNHWMDHVLNRPQILELVYCGTEASSLGSSSSSCSRRG